MNCSCHGEPMYWNRDPRKKSGGWHYCSVKARERSVNLYDQDPIYRLSKNLKQQTRERRKRLERMVQAHGKVSPEGQH